MNNEPVPTKHTTELAFFAHTLLPQNCDKDSLFLRYEQHYTTEHTRAVKAQRHTSGGVCTAGTGQSWTCTDATWSASLPEGRRSLAKVARPPANPHHRTRTFSESVQGETHGGREHNRTCAALPMERVGPRVACPARVCRTRGASGCATHTCSSIPASSYVQENMQEVDAQTHSAQCAQQRCALLVVHTPHGSCSARAQAWLLTPSLTRYWP